MKRRSRRRFGWVRQLPSGKWQASYLAKDRRIFAPRTFPTKVAAGDWLTKIEADLLRGEWVDPELIETTLESFARSWLATKAGLAERTFELYTQLLDDHILPALGDRRLVDVKPSDVRAWFGVLSSKHPSTAAKCYRLLSSIFRTAVADELLARTPCTIRGAGTEPERDWVIVSQKDARKIADKMPDHLRALVILAAWCQLRRGELLGLRWGDVDLRRGSLTIRHTRTVLMSGGLVEKPPKSSAGRRDVAMPQIALEALQAHKSAVSRHAAGDLVFVGVKGGPLRPAVLGAALHKAVGEARCADVRLHDLRHSGLTWFGQAGATVAELMYRGGHSSPAAALRYQHATRARDAELARSLSHGNRTRRSRSYKTPG